MRNALLACLIDENGSEVVEYTLVVGLIVVGAIGVMSQLGVKIAARWNTLLEAML